MWIGLKCNPFPAPRVSWGEWSLRPIIIIKHNLYIKCVLYTSRTLKANTKNLFHKSYRIYQHCLLCSFVPLISISSFTFDYNSFLFSEIVFHFSFCCLHIKATNKIYIIHIVAVSHFIIQYSTIIWIEDFVCSGAHALCHLHSVSRWKEMENEKSYKRTKKKLYNSDK